ncbi:hypothetical protein ZEAMMB73_Zm00001d052806 [Zea mays]|uniref:Uncharacterized protein n=1 Tax=Zea mays TaxID=4577 RepID=A0A1D6QK70_MAIZE|nr:hypothetical protein ZEAMMB73_Zm00001d052806 [Zea mays]AQK58125.1 hypothetical protein ZEAMMB73_Zm00001d052806 [Zea mays]AQK58126.1 hypothetical protein ZEAMMB73_Zm00001d052806 [Zea mays]
MSPSLTGEAM